VISILKKIPEFLKRRQKINLIFFTFFSLFIPIFESFSVASLGAIVLFVIDIENFKNFIPSLELKKIILSFEKSQLIFYSSLLFLIVILIKNMLITLYFIFEGKIKRDIVIYHSDLLFNKFLQHNYVDLIGYNLSNIQNEILVQAKKISALIFIIAGFIKDMALALIFFVSLLLMNFKATLFLIILSLATILIFVFFTKKKIKFAGRIIRFREGELVKIVRATFEGFKIVILFGKKNFFIEKFLQSLKEMTKHELWYFVLTRIPRLLLEIVFALSLVIFLNYFIIKENNLDNILPFLVFLSLITMRMLPIFTNINLVISQMKLNQVAVESIIKILSDNLNITPKLDKSTQKKIRKDLFLNIKNLELRNVNFKYKQSQKKTLKNFSFNFKINKVYALTGKSGSGKSTLIDLIAGVFKPDNGDIFSGKNSIFDNLQEWQNHVGYVPQENFLINDTFKKNICFGENDKEFNKLRFNEAINDSGLMEFVDNLPKKEESEISDGGTNISGGQKQRIGLARALYQNRSILLLDESTSSLDSVTEKKIIQTLHTLKKNKIIIMIAHRQSTILECDELINLDRL